MGDPAPECQMPWATVQWFDESQHLAKMGGRDVDLLVDRGAYYTCSILFPSFNFFPLKINQLILDIRWYETCVMDVFLPLCFWFPAVRLLFNHPSEPPTEPAERGWGILLRMPPAWWSSVVRRSWLKRSPGALTGLDLSLSQPVGHLVIKNTYIYII